MPIAQPKEGLPGMAVTADHSGYKFTQHRYEWELAHGVSAKYFTPRNDKDYPWYMSGDDEPLAAQERLEERNAK